MSYKVTVISTLLVGFALAWGPRYFYGGHGGQSTIFDVPILFSNTQTVSSTDSSTSVATEKTVDLVKTYTNTTYKLSFQYPEGFTARVVTNADKSDTILVSNGNTPNEGFQALIVKFDEPAKNFTVAKIQQDIPDLIMKDTEPFSLSSLGVGVAFHSNEEGRVTREVWFVRNGFLYQLSAPVAFEQTFQKILATWKFK